MSSVVELLGDFFGVEWSRPLFLLALLLAALTLLAGFVRSRPRMRPVGTTQLWRELMEERSRARSSDRVERRFPAYLWALAAALFCLSIALAGPIPKQPPLPRRFTVYVDARAGMGLEVSGETRAAKARAS
ncbi:MAG: BatA domain-containing protein, partial [Planctomycetota bacterium]